MFNDGAITLDDDGKYRAVFDPEESEQVKQKVALASKQRLEQSQIEKSANQRSAFDEEDHDKMDEDDFQ